MKNYKTFHGAKRGAIALARKLDKVDGLVISGANGYFQVRPAQNPWMKGRLEEYVCARFNADGQSIGG
jgi:hypothetical protein